MSGYPTEDEIIDLDDLDPVWEQHEDETDKNYAHFCAYRDLGRKRTKLKSYLNYSGKSREEHGDDAAPSMTYAWSKKFRWDDRVKAWDKHIDEKKEKEYEEEMMEYYEDVIQYSQNSSTHLLEALDARFKGKSPDEKAEMVFGEDSMNLEGFARTFQQLNNIASQAFGSFTNDENDEEADATLKIIEEATEDLD